MGDKRQIVGPVLREPEAPASSGEQHEHEWRVRLPNGEVVADFELGCASCIEEPLADLAREREHTPRPEGREQWEWHNYAAGAMTLTRKGGPSFTFIAASEFASGVEGDLNELRDYLNVLEADLAREREAHAATGLSERLYQESLAQVQKEVQSWRQQAEEANVALKAERVLREAAEKERDEEKRLHEVNFKRAGEWAARAGLSYGRAEAAEAALATVQAKYDALIPQFVQRVNQRANAETMRTGVLEGAHHRAIDAELEAWLAAHPAPQTEAPGGVPDA